MTAPFTSSDPVTWLRPFWADLNRQPFFANLAPELQVEQLATAVEQNYPAEAAEIRAWSPVAARTMLASLAQALLNRRPARSTDLWSMKKGASEARCVAVYTTIGVDLRLLQDGEMLWAELRRDGPSVLERAQEWRQLLAAAGWTRVDSQS